MIGTWLKRALLYGTEALVAVVLVLVFFFACLTLLGTTLPQGTSLRDLMGGSSWPGDKAAAARFRLDRDGALKTAGPKIIARLTEVRQRVKGKSSDRIDWTDARPGAMLEERHAVQTFALSSAVIDFEEHGEVTLGENSLLLLGAAGSDAGAQSGDVSLLVTRGAVRGSLGGVSGASSDFRVVTANGVARIDGAAPTTNFQVSVNPDRSSTFNVYKGATEITAGGRTVKLSANQAVTVAPGAAPGEPVTLPDAPSLLSPAEGAIVAYRAVPPPVAIGWRPVPDASGYRVQRARDPGFERLVDDQQVGTDLVEHGNLEPGEYCWRVSAMRGHVEGPSSAARCVSIVQDRVPPSLTVRFPDGAAGADTAPVEGETESGAEVFVASERVATDDAGRFRGEVRLRPGWNVVVVEAIDAAGNATYRSERLMKGEPPRARLR